MNIYYIDINEFKNTHNKNFLYDYADKNLNNEKRFYEHAAGRYLLKSVAQKIYKIENAEIVINNSGKPEFKYSDIHFSLSHSNDYVVACFDENKCGIDIEKIKERNFEKLSMHYCKQFKNAHEFYAFWTLKEASFKQGNEVKDSYSNVFKNDYYLTITSEKVFDKNIEIIKYNY